MIGSEPHDRGSAVWIVLLLGMVLAGGLAILLLSPHHGGGTDPSLAEEAVPDLVPVPSEPRSSAAGVEVEAPAVPAPVVKRAVVDDGSVATAGWIKGTVQLEAELVGVLDVYHVTIEEAVNDEAPNARPRKIRRFEQRYALDGLRKHAYFELANVPFSRFGWRVSVAAPNVNGSETVVQLTADQPGNEVFLGLRQAIDVHVVVKDQERVARPKIDVALRPAGRPRGRRVYQGTTDVYGLAMFEHVLRGDYELLIGPIASPVLKPQKVTVGLDKSPMFVPVQMPSGGSLTIHVINPGGYGVPDVEISAVARDSKIYQKHEAKTDKTGKAKLYHLSPGRYWLHATKKGFDRDFEKVTVTDRGDIEVRMTLNYVR